MTPNTRESDLVFVDFEYNGDNPINVLFGSFLHISGERTERITIDFRKPGAVDYLRDLQFRWQDFVWAAFAAHAEMTCFLTLGLEIEPMRWLDLFAEARQITGSHAHYLSRKAGLIQALQALSVPTTGSVAHKEAMRLLIIENSSFTSEQEQAIIAYNREDTEVLQPLWAAIQQVHAQVRKDYTLSAAVARAEYVKALAVLEYRSRGFPVDVAKLNLIYSNLKLVRRVIAEECNGYYGGKVFRYNKRTDDYSFSFTGLVEHVDSLSFPVDWELTASGRLRTDADYLEEFVKTNPYFKALHNTLSVLAQLKNTDLRSLITDGFIKGTNVPYYTSTGRNQPFAKSGFMLNLAPWQRLLVRPPKDHRLIMADWQQQEVFIAAALSGDTLLADALATGDVYLALAKMAGAVPSDATKQSHPLQRQTFKSCQLGVGYGMGATTLGKRIFLDLLQQGSNDTLDQCTEKAFEILRWHRDTFRAYWEFVAREVEVAKQLGWMRARDGWTYFANLNSRYTRLQNFHMQANGAVILREAVKRLATYPEIELVCTLHDSIMILCHEDDVIPHTNILRNCMTEASQRVLRGAPLPLTIPLEIKPPEGFDHTTGYRDERGTAMYHKIVNILTAQQCNN